MLRGAKHIVFYSLPEYNNFYPELVNLLREVEGDDGKSAEPLSCTVLFTKFERMALERIVGTKRCEHMLSSDKTTFMFC
jgi:U3 small nucleolar RNA-associated protein 25